MHDHRPCLRPRGTCSTITARGPLGRGLELRLTGRYQSRPRGRARWRSRSRTATLGLTQRAWPVRTLCPPRRSALPCEGGRLMTVRVISPTPVQAGAPVPCAHCTTQIPAEVFEYPYWTAARRQLSAWCPGCGLRVTVSARSWRNASGLTDLITA